MRLGGKTAVVIGAGPGPGEGMGNGRATVLRFAQEGAKVMAVDRDLGSAEETASMARQSGGICVAFEADVTQESTLAAALAAAQQRWGRIDILHYNVGVSIAGGDASLLEFTEEAFDRISAINLRGAIMACKHVIPIMRQQRRRHHHDLFPCRAGELSLGRLQGNQGGADRVYQTSRDSERRVWNSRQRDPAGPDRHANGGRYARPRERQEPRRGRRGTRCPRAAAPQNGYGLGRRQCGAVPRLR